MHSIRTTLAPWLSVLDSKSALAFYKVAFGAEELFYLEGDDNSIVARLSIDGAEFWLAEASPEHANFSPFQLGGGSIRLVLTVTDPDGTYQKVISAGAREICPPTDDNGWRVGRLEDPYGHHWEIARPL